MLDTIVNWYAGRGMTEDAARQLGWWASLGALLVFAVVLHFILKLIIIRDPDEQTDSCGCHCPACPMAVTR